MAQQPNNPVPQPSGTRTVEVEGRIKDTERHGRAEVPIAKHDDVLGTRVGSEAAEEGGLQPVSASIGGVADATRIRNKDLLKREEEENRRRGRRGPLPGGISVNWTGLMMVQVDDEKPEPRSGSFSGDFSEQVTIRRPTEKEIEEITASRGVEPRSGDKTLVKGSGTGGGGNPMHAGDAVGVSSKTADQQNPAGSGVRTSRN